MKNISNAIKVFTHYLCNADLVLICWGSKSLVTSGMREKTKTKNGRKKKTILSFFTHKRQIVLKASLKASPNSHWRYILKNKEQKWLGVLKLDSYLPKNYFVCFNKSPLKMMKNAFYFVLKTLFVLKIFRFLSWLFSHVEKRLDYEKIRLISQFMTSQRG